jgi:RimJ/RimL family protein N-acetyltransferase
LENMRQDGIRRVELMVEADNPRAFAFYRKLGFEQEGRLRAAYKRANELDFVDELLMARLL